MMESKSQVLAATVAVLRDGEQGIETLMLKKNSKIAFGGMWVFPGGRIDPEDYEGGPEQADDEAQFEAARRAAVREAREEASIELQANTLQHFSFWLPPPHVSKRFTTWFFAARAGSEAVVIDDGEITEYEWLNPRHALEKCDAREFELAPPTWVSLHTFKNFSRVDDLLSHLSSEQARRYETRMSPQPGGAVALWAGDAGYETTDPSLPGARHRLEMLEGAYRFLHHD